MAAERALKLVDPASGEVYDYCPGCTARDDEISGLHRALAAEIARFENLKRDKEREAREHQLWPVAREIVEAWRAACNHPRSSFGAAEFELIRVFLQDKQYGDTVEARKLVCLRAVAGASFDAFETRRKNGTRKRHDGLDLIFRSRSKFEEMANRAPREWRRLVGVGSEAPRGCADA